MIESFLKNTLKVIKPCSNLVPQIQPIEIKSQCTYTKTMNDFTIHACEQSLRFSTDSTWANFSDKLKMQFSFNVGVMALGLGLSKEDGYQYLADVCQGKLSMREFHDHVRSLLVNRGIVVNEENVNKPF